MKTTAAMCLAAVAIGACAPVAIRTEMPAEWIPSPSFGERRPSLVVLHHTSDDTLEEALATLTDPRREVSAHYLVGRDGRLVQLVDERARAWHAGEGSWGGIGDLNSASIGIELDNNGDEPYPEPQIVALLGLLEDLARRWKIPPAGFVGHGDIAPGRKVDPGARFPWQRLAARGFGLWCADGDAAAPVSGDDATLLQALGYDVADPVAAAAAFRRHFAPGPEGGELSEAERRRLRCLVARRREDGAR